VSGFADIIGHRQPIDVLRRAMQNGKVAHAYLFTGAAGVGKTTVARTFAAALNCQTLPDDACGSCLSCRKTAQGHHPDFVELAYEPDPKTGKPSYKYKIEQIRLKVIKQSYYRPLEGRARVFLIKDADTMTLEAANALLKTLEEPNAQNVFLLVTAQPQLLPSTIRSRCQLLRFGALSTDEISRFVVGEMGASEEEALTIAALADGSLGKAAAMDLEYLQNVRLPLFAQLLKMEGALETRALALGEMILAGGEDMKEVIDLLTGFLHDALQWRVEPDPARIRNRDALALVEQYARQFDVADIYAKMRSLVYARRLVERNVHKQMIANGLGVDLLATQASMYTRGRLPK